MFDEYLARALHQERLTQLQRDLAADEARRIAAPRTARFAWFRRGAQRASRPSSAARASGQPVSSIE